MQVQILGPVRAIAAQGSIAISQEAAADEDLSTQAISRGLLARILADRGHYRDAEALARSAAEPAAQSDLLSEHADIMLDLAHVLAAADRIPEAHAAATGTLDLYQRKGHLPGARESLRYLAQYAPA